MCGGKFLNPSSRQSQVGLCQVTAKLSAEFWSSVGGRVGRPTLAGNGFGLGEGGDFHHLGSTEIDAENQTLINHKCVCGALNRHFCQTRVMRSYLISV